MSTDHFTSDLHLDDKDTKVTQLRGFAHWLDHAMAIVTRWNLAVKPQDRVWVLGDLATASDAFALEMLAGMNGEKHLILGNHDAGHPMHRNAHRKLTRYSRAFASVSTAGRRVIAGEDVLLSHFPYERDHKDPPRHMQWRLPNRGAWLLHGHTHGTEQATIRRALHERPEWDGSVLPPRSASREIHVGLDAWDLSPVPLRAIETLIRSAS